jgi:hypothetical protein
MGNNLGMWAMISGIVAIVMAFAGIPAFFIPFCGCCTGPIGFIAAVAAIILGIVGLVQKGSKGMSILGIGLGVAYFLLSIIIFVIMLVVGVGLNFASGF